jgi:hypothetical protein
VSANPFDYVSRMQCFEHGVWIAIRGSALLYLYSKLSYKRVFVFDLKTGQRLSSIQVLNSAKLCISITLISWAINKQKDEEFTFNSSRITSTLSFNRLLWVIG